MLNIKDFAMPAEWERHERTLIEWPVKESMVWPENYAEVCAGYAEVANAISAFEKVTLIVNEETAAEARLLCGDDIEYVTIPHNDAWCRDNGPTFLLNNKKQLAAVNWQFNAWGEKYPDFKLDNQVAPAVLEYFNVPFFNSPIILEGGSIHTDGQGTLLSTKECLLNKNRNSGLSQIQIEAELRRCLNVSTIIWLNKGLAGDETDGHVDNIACFAKPGVIFIQTCYDENDSNYKITQENIKILSKAVDAAGRKLDIVEIPQPPIRHYNNERLTLSYLNFYFVNGGIILPVFGGDAALADRRAEEIIKSVCPDRKIVKVDGMPLIKEGGNVHCITQQMPKGVRIRRQKA